MLRNFQRVVAAALATVALIALGATAAQADPTTTSSPPAQVQPNDFQW